MSSDSNIYIKTIETASELGAFEITGTGATSLIKPNDTKPGYSISQTSFVVGSDQLDDYSSTTEKDKRMFFDKINGSFRAGSALSTQWDNTDSNPNRGGYSTALGLNNIASGDQSFAAGSGNTASGENAVTLGDGNTSGADGAVTIGHSNNVTALNAVAIGENNEASAENATAIGNNNTSTAANTFTGGNACNASQPNAVAIGQYCKASGVNSTSIGYGIGSDEPESNTASGEGSVAIGNSNTASALNAVAIGESNISAGTKSFTFGTANYCNTDAINSIAIGNGVLDSQSDNNNNVCGQYSITIGRNNNIGSTSDRVKRYTDNSIVIGTSNTLTGLTGTPSNNSIILGSNCTVTNCSNSIVLGNSATLSENYCFFWNGDNQTVSDVQTAIAQEINDLQNGSAVFWCATAGLFQVTFGTSGFGRISASSGYAWASSSSRDLKENLVEHDYSDTLTRIMDMPIYTYNFRTVDPGIKSIGPVAQDFNRLFPSDKDQLSIVERDMCGVALAGVKGVKLGLDSLYSDVNTRFENVDSRFASNSDTTSALQSRIAVLESSLVSASAQIAAMESRLAALEAP